MLITFLIALGVVLLDQISKLIIELTYAQGESTTIIKNFLYITKEYNTGAGWSLFSNNTVLLTLFSLICSVGFSYLIYRMCKTFKDKKVFCIALAFILGGTVGNLIDRFLTSINQRKGVVDFIDVMLGSYDYPVFNLADSFLVVGVIMAIIDIIFFMDKRKKKESEPVEEDIQSE